MLLLRIQDSLTTASHGERRPMNMSCGQTLVFHQSAPLRCPRLWPPSLRCRRLRPIVSQIAPSRSATRADSADGDERGQLHDTIARNPREWWFSTPAVQPSAR